MPYIIAIVVLVVAAVGFSFLQNKDVTPEVTLDQQTTDTPTSTPDAGIASEPTSPEGAAPQNAATSNEAPTQGTEAVATSDYKDGTYRSQVTYFTPNRDEYLLDVSLTLKDDVVTAANVTYSQGAEKDPNAQRFEKAYRTEVIGKEIESLNLSRVGGASLTTGAFNEALAEIKADADA